MAYDLIARVAALAAINSIRGSSIDLFVNIGTHTFDTAVTAITTGGCSVTGIGAATYVADSVATATLAAANPNLCKKSQDGRYWRLIANNGGITVDQAGALGDPTGTGLVNDHAAIQAALNYAAALGIRTVVFPQRNYAVWNPVRTSTFWNTAATDGIGMVIPALTTGDIVLQGTGGHSRIAFYNIDGQAFQSHYQAIAADGNPWRGHGLYIVSPSVDPGKDYRPSVTLENIWLDGGTTANGNLNWANPVTDVPNGWDVSHKGILVQPDLFSGDLVLRNTRVTGFRGELVYSSNMRDSRLILEGRVELGETNGQVLNPAGGGIFCPGYVVAWNCNTFFEGWCGMGNLRGEFHNVLTSSSSLTGGVVDATGSGIGYKPQRLTETPFTNQASYFELDIQITSPQQTVNIGSFLRGRIIAIDTTVAVAAHDVAGPFQLGVIDSDLEIISVCDKGNLQTALALTGGSTAGQKQIRNCRYRLSLKRTRDAITAGFQIIDAVVYSGSIGEDVAVEQSSGPSKRGSATGAVLPDYYPVFRNNTFQRPSDYSTVGQNVVASPAIIPRGDFMAVLGGTATNSTTTVTLPTAGIVDGHELTLYNGTGPTGYWNFAIDRSGGGAKLPARRIVAPDAAIQLRFDGVYAIWREAAAPPPLSAAAIVSVPAVTTNGVSAVQTLTVPGAEVGMSVRVIAQSDLGAAAEICQMRVSAANTVSFRIRDLSGSGVGAATTAFLAVCQWERTP